MRSSFDQPDALGVGLRFAGAEVFFELGCGLSSGFGDLLSGQASLGAPLLQHCPLDLLHGDVRQFTLCASSVPLEAEEALKFTTLASALAVADPAIAARADQTFVMLITVASCGTRILPSSRTGSTSTVVQRATMVVNRTPDGA